MRILFFSRDYTVHDWRFLDSLRSAGDDIFYLRLENSGIIYERRPIPDGVQIVAWPGGTQPQSNVAAWLALVPALEDVLRDVAPDVVHAGPVQSCGFMAALLNSRPLIVMSWGSDVLFDAERDPLMRWIARFTLRRCDCLVADCQAVADKAREIAGGVLPETLQFPWGIELNEYVPGVDRRETLNSLGWEEAFVLISTRAWEPIYGIDTLLRAFRLALKKEPKLRLLMPGAGGLAPQVHSFIQQHGLADFISTPGLVGRKQLFRLFGASDLYLSCSLSDGTSISLLEAMAMCLPVAVTDIPGNREWVTDGNNGWLFPVQDEHALAAVITRAVSIPPAQLSEMGRENRRIVSERANWERNFPQLPALYRQLYGHAQNKLAVSET